MLVIRSDFEKQLQEANKVQLLNCSARKCVKMKLNKD